MKERKSMRGVTVDLGKLMAQQEKNISVGNTKSNARGDQLGRAGRVVKSAAEIAREHYNQNNPNAVKKTTLKTDDILADIEKKGNSVSEDDLKEAAKAASEFGDDWEEPVVEETVEETLQDIAEEEAVAETDDDEWVEDAEGNFVRASELAESVEDEPVSKSKTSRKKK